MVGQFTVNLVPTFFIGGATYTLDPVQLVVTDGDKRPYPLVPNPTMFSINGFNYVIDSNRVPHTIVGNNNVSPLATDVTVESGNPIPHSTFTLNGQVYEYVEDGSHNLLAITGLKSFMIAQPALTFKLDSSLVFTLSTTPPAAGNFVGSVTPIGTITAGTTVLNVYAGTPESGGADFFTFKNVLYTLVKSGAYVRRGAEVVHGVRVEARGDSAAARRVRPEWHHVSRHRRNHGRRCVARRREPGSMWAATSISNVETQFGLVYGFTAQPTNVTRTGTGLFQFQAADSEWRSRSTTSCTLPGGNVNVVRSTFRRCCPRSRRPGRFTFTPSYPLTFETGGYNAFTTFVEETSSRV